MTPQPQPSIDPRPTNGYHGPLTTRRLVAVTLFVCFVGILAFFITSTLVTVPQNERDIRANCEDANYRTGLVNKRFTNLDKLFRAASLDVAQPGGDYGPEVIAAYAEFQKPIPLINCNS